MDKLIDAMPSPVLASSGATKSPSDCRAPIVTINTPAAESVINHSRWVLSERNMR